MHHTALENAAHFLRVYNISKERKSKLLDIGSVDVNGSIKEVCSQSIDYLGVDFCVGRNVDIVIDSPYELPFDDCSFDFVTSSSCYEHSEFFWLAFLEALRVLKPTGLLYINAPSNAAFHRYPVDCWRFYPDSGHALVNWGRKNGFHCILLESYISNQKRGRVNDFVCVILKNQEFNDFFPNRILDTKTDYTNGRTNRSEEFINLEWETEDHRKYPMSTKLKMYRRRLLSWLRRGVL